MTPTLERLEAYRVARGLTQMELAARIGKSPRTIRWWKEGKKGIPEKLLNLALDTLEGRP